MLLLPLSAEAGMTRIGFTDIVRARLEVISFFLIGYFALAFLYQRLWNSLRRDFTKMPLLSYRGSLAALIVCGLFIYVILTMISGARELMTPGAWVRSGVLYKIREPEKDPKPWLDTARRGSLERARAALWQYAEKHGNTFPRSREASELPASAWKSIDPDGLQLVYLPGAKPDIGREVLLYEPVSFGANRYVLLSNGEIVQLPLRELTERVREQIRAADVALGQQTRP